jgi:hypothetical protein
VNFEQVSLGSFAEAYLILAMAYGSTPWLDLDLEVDLTLHTKLLNSVRGTF